MADAYGPYYERTSGVSPNSGGMSIEGGGRWVRKILVGDKGNGSGAITSITTLHNQIREILGTTAKHNDGYRIFRQNPKALPEIPWLYAERISSITGHGRPTQTSAPSTPLNAGPFDEFALYPTYELTVEFAPMAYPMAQDEDISTSQLSWTTPAGSSSNKTYAKEWYRNTTFERAPAAEWITAEAGQFAFDVASGQTPDGKQASKGQIKMLIPQNALKVTWHRVPAEFVDHPTVDPYLRQGLGHVNQNSIWGRDAGTLLLTAINVQRYQPPIPDFGYAFDSLTIVAPKLLCNITMIFLERKVTLGKDAAGNTATPDAAVNANAIQAGHNLFPYAHMSDWYYAKTVGVTGFTSANDRPAFPSFPMELLFTNPGV